MTPPSISAPPTPSIIWQGQWLLLPSILAFVTFSWMPLSYYRMVAWPWILVWQLGWIALLSWGIWQLRQFHHPFCPLGYSLDGVIVGLGMVLLLSSTFSEFPRVALGNASLAITYGIGLYIYHNWLSTFKVSRPLGEEFRERDNPAMTDPVLFGQIALTKFISNKCAETSPSQTPQPPILGVPEPQSSSKFRNLGDQQIQREIRHLVWCFLVATATLSAIISLIFWQPNMAMWQSTSFNAAIRNHQPLGHHNFVGGYFALMLPLAAAGCVAAQGWRRWATGLSAGLMLLALYASGSRGAALGCLVWLLATWLSLIIRVSGKQRWHWGAFGLAGIVIAASTLATNLRIRTWFIILFSDNFLTPTITDGPTLDRWFMLRLGVNILHDRPLLGVGPGVMSRVSNLYRPIEAGAGLDHIQQLHNTPVQIAGELGLAGLSLVFIGLVLLGRLSLRLWRQPLSVTDRALLGGILGSFTAYGIASLTDYQLENIPIAATLLVLMVLLLDLADSSPSSASSSTPAPHFPVPPSSLASSLRRILSLSLWAWLGILVCLWLPFSLTIYFTDQANRAFRSSELSTAGSYWYKASHLSPWDPTAAANASQNLFKLQQMMGNSDLRDEIQSLMLDYGKQAQAAAPNDVWFNQNLAIIYQTQGETVKALPLATRAVRLLPRNASFSYFLLGQLLLAQGKFSQATSAFTLAALVQPEILTSPLWQRLPLQNLYTDIFSATLAAYNQLLHQVEPSAPGYQTLYETKALLTWWGGKPLFQDDVKDLSPLLRLLVLADTDPQAALSTLEEELTVGQGSAAIYLLAAWLAPDQYWSAYASHADALPEPELTWVRESLSQRQIRSWLATLSSRPSTAQRTAVAFAYRNAQAQYITQMLKPQELELSTLVTVLGLFPTWPREFPALDRYIEHFRTFTLGLPHPTRSPVRRSFFPG